MGQPLRVAAAGELAADETSSSQPAFLNHLPAEHEWELFGKPWHEPWCARLVRWIRAALGSGS